MTAFYMLAAVFYTPGTLSDPDDVRASRLPLRCGIIQRKIPEYYNKTKKNTVKVAL